jgi:asparagine synthase (glutamine-hydrolysing)
MSGVAGILHFDGRPVQQGLVDAMTAAMAARGPDGVRHFVRGSAALGHCMLRTTPESLEERQPLTNEDESLVLVMDGRVDNWRELRAGLLSRGVALRTRSDAELVLRAYETWGDECIDRVDGDFALVIWDERRRRAFCARDRLGNKPFHYHWDGSTLAFASELHPILALPWVRREPNEGMLAEFLAAEWH